MNPLRNLLTPGPDGTAEGYRQIALLAAILLALIIAAGIAYAALI